MRMRKMWNHLTTKDEIFDIHFKGLQYIYFIILTGLFIFDVSYIVMNWPGDFKTAFETIILGMFFFSFSVAGWSYITIRLFDCLFSLKKIPMYNFKAVGMISFTILWALVLYSIHALGIWISHDGSLSGFGGFVFLVAVYDIGGLLILIIPLKYLDYCLFQNLNQKSIA